MSARGGLVYGKVPHGHGTGDNAGVTSEVEGYMFERFGRSIDLAKASFGVLRSDKELLLFPFVSFIALAIVTALFAVPFLATGAIDDATNGVVNIASYVILFLFYLVSYTVTFFFQTGLVGAALIRLDGGDPTLRDGFRIAMSRLPQIIGYALIAATVGMILRMIAERAGLIGQIIVGIIGFAWNVATFLVVPVLAVEGVGPIEAIKRSGGYLRRTWGEQIIGNVGIGLLFGLLSFVVIVAGIALIVVVAQASTVLMFAVIALMILALAIIGLIGSAVGGIYVASLYRYATKGDAGPMFRNDVVAGAFRQRGAKRAPRTRRPVMSATE
jgi:hypothetical protein